MKFPHLFRFARPGLFMIATAAQASAQLAATSAVPAQSVTTGASVSFTPVTATGGTAPYTYAIAPGLPAGLTVGAASGSVAGTVAAGVLTPPFIGYDGFDAGTGHWGYDFRFGSGTNGQLTFVNNRLEFTKAAGTGSHVRGWDGDPASSAYVTADSYAQSWTCDIAVAHAFTAAAGEFASFGVEVTDPSGHYSALMLVNGGGVLRVRAEGTGATATEQPLPTGTTQARLRLQWDAGAKILRAAYSTDNGATYSLLYSFMPDAQWGAASTAGFYFEVFGNSNAAAAIPAAAMWGDNFKLSASAPTTHTVTVTDAASASANATFALTVNPPALVATVSTPSVAAVVGKALAPIAPVAASGGIVPYTYLVFPALPAGLALDPASGQVSGTPAVGTATPLFAGADDFNSGSDAKWAYYFQQGVSNGALSFTNGRLDFTKAGGVGNYFLGWDGDPTTANNRTTASTATSWVADLAVTNTATSANESYTIGFEAAGLNQWGAVALTNESGALSVMGDGANTPLTRVPATTATDVRLRLVWDAPTQVLKSYCSFDHGASYSLVRSYSPFTEWTAGSLNNGFFFEVFARSNSAAAISAGAMYADNFSVAATTPATSVHTLTVSDRVGTFSSGAFSVTVRATPTISSVSPAAAAPGSVVTISGAGLAEATSVTFGTVSASFTYDAASGTLSALVPATARSGSVVVTTPAGQSTPFSVVVPLTITSQPSHNVVTPGQATSVGVIAAGGAQTGSYAYQWRRNGVAINGATSQIYYIPAMSAADAGDYDVVVTDGTSAVTSGLAALRLATSGVWQWRNRLPTGSDLSSVAFGAGRYVAVGSAGTIVTSTDGATWVPQPQLPPAIFNRIVFNGSQFVAVGTNGNVIRSSDGLTWTQHNVGASATLLGLAYGNGRWVATGSRAVFTSADGATWTKQNFSAATFTAVTATPTGFLAVSTSGDVATSDVTAATWTVTQPLAGAYLIDVAYANGTYVIAARGQLYHSTDGANWTQDAAPTTDAGIDWNRIVVTADGFTIAGASYASTSPTPKGYVIQSANGTAWTLKNVPLGPGLEGITYGASGYVAVGDVGQVVSSSDNVTWTVRSSGPGLPGDLLAAATGPAGSLFAGAYGHLYWSADSLSGWSKVDLGTTYGLYGATFGAGRYVVVGGNDSGSAGASAVFSATNGAGPWTKVDLSGPAFLGAVAYDARVGRFVAAGAGPNVYWAADPAGAWTAVAKPAAVAVHGAAASGGRYVLVGDAGAVLTSGDGAAWTQAAAVTDVALQAVAFGNGRWVAVGFNGVPSGYRAVIITSTDGGITWQNVPVPFTGSLRAITFADGRFTAIGGTSTVLTSSDGLTWSAETSQFSGLFRAIVRTPEGYLAGGSGGAIASLDAPKTTTAVATLSLMAGEPANYVPVTAAGGHPGYTFTVTPALPGGLVLDPATGAVSGAATAATAPFAGTDNFDAASDAKWAYYFRAGGAATGNGMLSFTNGRLDFAKNAGLGTYFLGWDGDGDPNATAARTTASLGTSWSAEVTANNTYSAASGEYADVGLEVAGPGSQWASILLTNSGGTLVIRGNCSGVAGSAQTPVGSTTVKLRMTWDASTQVLATSYSVDGGANYVPFASYSPVTSWTAGSASGGFYFEIFGESNAAAAISPGSLYLDDFAVKALAPPTTLYTVTATDRLGVTSSSPFSLTIVPGLSITSVAPASAAPGASVTITGTSLSGITEVRFNGVPATSFTVVSSTQVTAVVPSGASTGLVTVRTAGGLAAQSATPFTVNPVGPIITSAGTASAVSGRSFLYAITTNPTPVTYSASGLPVGLSVDAVSGVISGVPTTTGTFSVTVMASNVTATASKSLLLTVTPPPPIINSAAAASARVGATFSYVIAAVNAPTSYGAIGLPAGLVLNSTTGAITGTPTVAGTFTVTLQATNAGGSAGSPLVLTIDPPLNAPTYTGATQASGVQNGVFSYTPTFNTNGLSTTYAATGLPAGLSIGASTGVISGTPTATGTFTVSITATNSGGSTTVPFTFTINPPPTAPTITSASTASGTVGTAFSFLLTATGGATNFTADGLPALGLSLNASTGLISGVPSAPGTLTLAVSAANSTGTGPQAALVVTVNPSPNAPMLSSASVAQGRVGDAFTFTLAATNSPTAFAVTSGTLPAGLSLDASSGVISGTPTQVGQFATWIAARNASGPGYALQVLFNIAPALTTPVITSNGTAAAQVGQPFRYQIAATNSPTSFVATGLVAGLVLDPATGVISGIPLEATTSAVSITLGAANGSGASAAKTLLLTVAPAPATPVITSPLSAPAQVGAAFTYQITGSETPTSYVALNLPAGLALNATTGALTGTPTLSGSFNVTLRAANTAGLGAASTLVLAVAPAASAPAITSAAAASGKVGVAFNYAITTSSTVTSFGLSGTLPLGLALNTSTGVLSGTPAASGVFTVQLTATSSGGTSLPQTLVLNIAPADNVPVITSPIYASATAGQAFTYQVTAASTPAFPAAPFPAPFMLDAVNLPAGLAINPSTGLIQGVPSAAGMFTATLVGTNSAGTGAYRDLTIFVAPAATAPTVTSSPYAAAQVGVAFGYRITGTNSPTSFDVLGAPAWLTVNNTTGTLAGTPTSPGTFTVQLLATNSAGSSTPLTLTLTVAPSANAPVVTSPRTASGTVSQPFTYQISAAVPSGAPAVTAFVATGIPPGLSLNATTGVISGTPSASGQYEVTLIARNSAGESQPVTLILTIQPSLQLNGGS